MLPCSISIRRPASCGTLSILPIASLRCFSRLRKAQIQRLNEDGLEQNLKHMVDELRDYRHFESENSFNRIHSCVLCLGEYCEGNHIEAAVHDDQLKYIPNILGRTPNLITQNIEKEKGMSTVLAKSTRNVRRRNKRTYTQDQVSQDAELDTDSLNFVVHKGNEIDTDKNEEFSDFNFHNSAGLNQDMVDYSKAGSNAFYNNFTHMERLKLQSAYQRRCYNERKLIWQKQNFQPQPEKEAKLLFQANQSVQDKLNYSSGHSSLLEISDDSPEDEKLRETVVQDEIASRIRTKIRHEKLQNASIMKASIPNVAGNVLDPVKFHVQRRTERLVKLLHAHLEGLLTWNSPNVLYGILMGLTVSIQKIKMKSPRAACTVYYSISKKHNALEAQKRLDKVAPVLRFQIARKLELGYTPELRFVPYQYLDEMNKFKWAKIANSVSANSKDAELIMDSWVTKMNKNP